MGNVDGIPPMKGHVEVDETYIGGNPANNLRKKRIRYQHDKIPVMALIERGGEMRMFPMPDTKFSTMRSIVHLNVDDTAHIVTDGHPAYRKMPPYFAKHDWVNHFRRPCRDAYSSETHAPVNTGTCAVCSHGDGCRGSTASRVRSTIRQNSHG